MVTKSKRLIPGPQSYYLTTKHKSNTDQVPLGIVLLIRDGHILLQLVLMVDQGQLLIEQLRLGQYVLIGVGEDVAVIRIMTVVQVLLVR